LRKEEKKKKKGGEKRKGKDIAEKGKRGKEGKRVLRCRIICSNSIRLNLSLWSYQKQFPYSGRGKNEKKKGKRLVPREKRKKGGKKKIGES